MQKVRTFNATSFPYVPARDNTFVLALRQSDGIHLRLQFCINSASFILLKYLILTILSVIKVSHIMLGESYPPASGRHYMLDCTDTLWQWPELLSSDNVAVFPAYIDKQVQIDQSSDTNK